MEYKKLLDDGKCRADDGDAILFVSKLQNCSIALWSRMFVACDPRISRIFLDMRGEGVIFGEAEIKNYSICK